MGKYNNKGIVIKTEKARKGNDAKSVQKSALDKVDEIKQQAIYGENFKVVVCFDKDDNKIDDISDIIIKNERSKTLATIYNNPCYEYWLLLHIKPTAQGFINSEQCCRETMKEINAHYRQNFIDLDKFKSYENIFNIVGDDLSKAIKNAKSLHLEDYNSTYFLRLWRGKILLPATRMLLRNILQSKGAQQGMSLALLNF